MRAMTLRMSDEQGELLDMLARVQERSKTAVLLEALDSYVEREVAAGMLERVRARHRRERALYERLVG